MVEVETKNPVHPHACGEHGNFKKTFNLLIGSSPRLWGTRIIALLDLIQHRFIPTPVGNTTPYNYAIAIPSVHPHACGEHFLNKFSLIFLNGSSPRLWGTLPFFNTYSIFSRFIPTPVGNTHNLHCSKSDKTVHPHACGEHLLSLHPSREAIGSSPRLWGTPELPH